MLGLTFFVECLSFRTPLTLSPMPVDIAIVIYHIVIIKATFDARVDLGNGVKF
jgi:hypothetical protein